jgi:predicted lipid-binding transport protein (Tim44 family)
MKTETRMDHPTYGIREGLDRDTERPGARKAVGRYRHARYSHRLSDEATETASRLLTRIVPLVFGAMLGSLADQLAIGLISALAVSLAFDCSMEGHSIIRGLYRRFRGGLSPLRGG